MYDCRRIYWCAHTLRRLEPHLAGSSHRRFIQPMTQSPYDAIHMQLPIRAKQHFEQNFSLQLQLAGFLGINRTGFRNNLHLRRRRAAVGLGDLRSVVRNLLRAESCSLHRSPSVPVVALRNPISEARAGDGALDAVCATCSVSLTLAL